MSSRRPSQIGLAVIAALVAATASARAQNADAEALFTEASQLEGAGEIGRACEAFEASNRIEPRAGTLIRLGQCYELQARLASAWSAYKDALTRVKDPKKRAVAQARVDALGPDLSYLTVLVPDDSRVDGLVVLRNGTALDPALWNRATPVDGGVYTISGEAPGHEAWLTTVEVGDRADRASVEVPRFKELRELVAPTPGVEDDEDTDDAGVEDAAATPGRFTTRRKLAIGLGGAGVVAVGIAIGLGVQARGLEDDAFSRCPDPAASCDDAAAAQALLDRAAGRALGANLAYGVAGAAVLTAAVLWFTGAPSADERVPRVGARLGDGGASVDATWRF